MTCNKIDASILRRPRRYKPFFARDARAGAGLDILEGFYSSEAAEQLYILANHGLLGLGKPFHHGDTNFEHGAYYIGLGAIIPGRQGLYSSPQLFGNVERQRVFAPDF